MTTKPKIILFDIDNVLIRPPRYFSEELEEQGHKDAVEHLKSFFLNEDWRKCKEGKADPFKLVAPYLKKFGWKKSAKEFFLQHAQFGEKYLDKNFISNIKKLKEKGIKCYLCTDQAKYKAEYLLNDMGFKDIFYKHFISHSIGYRKCHDEFWVYVLKELKKEFKDLDVNEIVYFDDSQDNVDLALKFGIKGFVFTDIVRFNKDMKLLGF